jgi:hypothetical protein
MKLSNSSNAIKSANRVIVKLRPFFSGEAAATALLASVLSMGLLAPAANAEVPASTGVDSTIAVGEVSLVLGKAYALGADQQRRPLKAGSQLLVSDQILTEANGHVHIRFIDHALVSVRPDSLLEITRYDYDAAKPANSTIKFNLVEGVTRAISGAGAKAARSRFRLNTPIAAIGVRGTDFVVSATDQSTRALVNQGAIVMAPYSTECTVAAFGPCATNAMELSENTLQIIELDGSTLSPRLIPAPHEREPGTMREEVRLAITQETAEDADEQAVGTDIYLENVTSRKVAAQAAVVPVPSSTLQKRQLAWGRWSADPAAAERIALSYAEARPDREITVGNFDYGLFRKEPEGAEIKAGLGPVSFDLNSAQASYSTATGILAMEVTGGNLDIDFVQSRFATSVNLNSSTTGLVAIRASGAVSERGFFSSRSGTQRLAGAVSQDGAEAGYFFEQQLLGGTVSGLTLWDAK